MAGAGKARAPNKCGWLKRGGKESCGKRCYGAYCGQHNYQLKKGMKEPQPCRGCGIGLISDYRLCSQCGGNAVKMRRYRARKKAKKQFELVLRELQERNEGKARDAQNARRAQNTPVRET